MSVFVIWRFCTEAESGHHVSCSDFTFTDHFSCFAFTFHLHIHSSRFKFTFGFIVPDSLRAPSSGDASKTCAPPSIPRVSKTWLYGQEQRLGLMNEKDSLCALHVLDTTLYQCVDLNNAHNIRISEIIIGLHKVSCGLRYSVEFPQFVPCSKAVRS